MNTQVYFIRHAEPDYTVHEDAIRPLTAKGLKDAEALIELFSGIPVDQVYASPFLRAVDTVRPLAAERHLMVETVEDFRERRVDSGWIEDFHTFSKRQWADFQYKLTDGECLEEVQQRNVRALTEVLKRHPGGHIVIGTHGTALSTLLHHYDPTYGYEWFERIRTVMPLVMKATFAADGIINITEISIITAEQM